MRKGKKVFILQAGIGQERGVKMYVKEARVNDEGSYLLRVYPNKDTFYVLNIPRIEQLLTEMEMSGTIDVTGIEGIHLLVLITSKPSIDQLRKFTKEVGSV